ncbi:MAG: DNA-directed RNA polymerase subunit beta' [Chloroflexi bacterium]|jgi:DNA-directed RNA polymerase subunit beta'|nr:DNA-directed RNA polymerase subunit beta' [Chloroflexota bacterium]MBT4514580.1 DNA-directed RNA polymerase subunit beta' [Chloroflexota bacterium]MBT6681210.1 DNA-directed RNA polymerase subunit beta' [Chloroflexota bacterium]
MTTQAGPEFNAIRISLASPEQIRAWSFGEVTKPETINYRTLRPEKDGLFCERIFGPTKDWECYCGKYKKIRYKGVVCDRCGVEIARAKVRRERMGHIRLAAPVAHIWFSKGTPSRLGLLLDISPRNLERVLYFAQYIVTSVDEEARARALEELESYLIAETTRIDAAAEEAIGVIRAAAPEEPEEEPVAEVEEEVDPDAKPKKVRKPRKKTKKQMAEELEAERAIRAAHPVESQVMAVEDRFTEERTAVEEEIGAKIDELNHIAILDLLTESRYRELRDRFGEVFRAGMGAEAALEILSSSSLEGLRDGLQDEVRTTSGQRRKKAIKRLRVIEAFVKSGNKPEWMVLTQLPVLPPELRPMVQLDGGRFATSDLNDLYRRVINRNNRLKRLLELQAPDIIVRNEKRMLQEAVDALIDNGRRGRAISGSHNHKLKSLTDLLRGKQGRFRQNLLGKRVDYSGRSVIIVGPQLKLHQCGLPKKMALELFKPFVMNALVVRGYAHNIKSAKRMVERTRPEVWDILEEVIQNRPVLLNRAPTLHRLGIQAFQPTLVEGQAIQIHPLVCKAFNADFDGDQMAVHVPLSREAVLEAQRLMLSTYNMLAPSSGDPIVSPTLDMVLGNYYLTGVDGEDVEAKDADDVEEEAEEVTEVTDSSEEDQAKKRVYSDFADARLAHDLGVIELRELICVRSPEDGVAFETTVGRIIFNETVPPELGYQNRLIGSNEISELVSAAYGELGNERTAEFLDALKDLGFRYATQSGTTIAINDVKVPAVKGKLLADGDSQIAKLDDLFLQGMIDEDSRYQEAVNIWMGVNDKLTDAVQDELPNYGGIYTMAHSGAKGNIQQIKQMAGMRGLMSDPKGRIIELPIRSSFREGLSVFEYFISTHGARKGLADTALRTADSGYLTRRLADVAQDVIVLFENCGTGNGVWLEAAESDLDIPLIERIVSRYPAMPVLHPETGEEMVDIETLITAAVAARIIEAGVDRVLVRSPLSCEAPRGLCQRCYGASLANGQQVLLGEAAGIIAAQSIGEPGTQLTMRTFHTGGVASALDITSGLPRVEELFEARQPRGMSILTEVDGAVEVSETSDGRFVTIRNSDTFSERYDIPSSHKALIKSGTWVDAGTPIIGVKKTVKKTEDEMALALPDEIVSEAGGTASVSKGVVTVTWEDSEERQYAIPAAAHIMVNDGEEVEAGTALTDGPKSPQDILRIEGHQGAQAYLTQEVLRVYRSQGVPIHEKHVEVIIRQMMRKVRVDTPGSTDLLPGELVDRLIYEEINNQIMANSGDAATASPVLLGVTRASLNTESFLAAASFQETARVLTEAAVNGSVDHLMGLKENVIIGRLIPARLDRSEEGRQKLGLDQIKHRIEGTLTGTTEAPPSFEEALRAFGGDDAIVSGGPAPDAAPAAGVEAPANGSPVTVDVSDDSSSEGDGLSRLLAALTGGDDDSSEAKKDQEAETPSGDD